MITSDYTPDPLLEYGVLHPYAYSRLAAMIGGRVLYVDGQDQRGLHDVVGTDSCASRPN